jgi:putative hydrolase of the HAD superfamily
LENANSFDALLVDFGGVLILPKNSPQRQRHLDRIGQDNKTFNQWLWKTPESRAAMTGELGADAFWIAVGAQVGLSEAESLEMSLDFWAGDELNHDVAGLVRRAREHGLRIGLLSNAYADLRPYLDEFGVLDLFDELIISALVGLAKPDPAIYTLACSKLGTALHRTLFIDDNRANVESALESGLPTLRYVGAETSIEAAQRLRLPPVG